MIKLRKDNLVVLGLSDENMKRLSQDSPIKFNLKDVGLGDVEVIIFNGRTESDMYMQLRDGIGPETDLRGCPTEKN